MGSAVFVLPNEHTPYYIYKDLKSREYIRKKMIDEKCIIMPIEILHSILNDT